MRMLTIILFYSLWSRVSRPLIFISVDVVWDSLLPNLFIVGQIIIKLILFGLYIGLMGENPVVQQWKEGDRKGYP